MSTQKTDAGITKNVLILTGTNNYQTWLPAMMSYLATLKVVRIALGTKLYPAAGIPEAQEAWENADMQANGAISLYIKENLRVHVRQPPYDANHRSLSLQTLTTLKTQFGKTGPTGQFAIFRQIMRWQANESKNISEQIAHLQGLYSELNSSGLNLPENLRAMILCAGLPDSLDGVITTAIHTKDATQFTMDTVVPMILAEGERIYDHSLVNRLQVGPSKQKGKKPQSKTKKPRCEKCRGTGHTTAQHRYDYVRPTQSGAPKKRKQPDSAVPQQTRSSKGKHKAHEATHVADVAMTDSSESDDNFANAALDLRIALPAITEGYLEEIDEEHLDWGDDDEDDQPVTKLPRLSETQSRCFRGQSV